MVAIFSLIFNIFRLVLVSFKLVLDVTDVTMETLSIPTL